MARELFPFVLSPDGTLYVDQRDSGIPWLIVLIDGFTLRIERTPRGGQNTLLTVEDVLNWHKQEAKHAASAKGRRDRETCAAHFTRVLEIHRAGLLPID